MMAYTNHRKTPSATRTSGRKPKLTERDRRTLKRIVSKNDRTTGTKVTPELSIHLADPVRRELHKSNIHGRTATAKPLITENNAKRRKGWCDHIIWTSDDWKYVMWSDESSFTLFPTSGRVCVCRTPKEAYIPECLVLSVKHGGGSLTIWAAISWYYAGPIIALKGRLTSSDYVDIIVNQVVS